ncbi:MAG TPA: class I SAM-dependent methyltransferase, partial [Thermomicrobiales bacterium]|nr:class I SAM-dependent methyltransferase [Thermomicrobiales bacterium]
MTLATRIHGNEDPTYWLNRNQAETNRLLLQSRLINPITRAILVEAGLASGMTVLDIGSGPGDVALLAAKIVGPTGKVVGVDKDPAILEVARRRACAAGLTNVHFIDGDVRSVEPGASFDAITGRLVLLYLGDPVATLAALTERLRPGGIAAIQEANIRPETVYAHPQLGIWEKVSSWVGAAAGAAGLNQTIGFDLRRIFLSAGLPEPSMRFDSPLGGGMDWAGYDYIAATVRNMLPLILKNRIDSADEIDISTLADRLRIATTAAD